MQFWCSDDSMLVALWKGKHSEKVQCSVDYISDDYVHLRKASLANLIIEA